MHRRLTPHQADSLRDFARYPDGYTIRDAYAGRVAAALRRLELVEITETSGERVVLVTPEGHDWLAEQARLDVAARQEVSIEADTLAEVQLGLFGGGL